MSWSCRDCGSTRLVFTLGPCAECGESLDGEPNPASRSNGMFHRRCWHSRVNGGLEPFAKLPTAGNAPSSPLENDG